jgi:hypothetical protein
MHSSLRDTLEKIASSAFITTGLLISAALNARALPTAAPTIPNGQYLYGEVTTPNEIGNAYLVFEAVDGRVSGAFYMPHSSFDCFTGELASDRLEMTLVDSYEGSAWNYEIPIDRQAVVASNATVSLPVALQGYHQLAELSDNDRRILNVCAP